MKYIKIIKGGLRPKDNAEVFVKNKNQIGTATYKASYREGFKPSREAWFITGSVYFEPTHFILEDSE